MNPQLSTDGTAYWNQSGSRWSWDLTVSTFGDALYADKADARGFIFDAYFQPVPEPSGAMLVGVAGMIAILRRRRPLSERAFLSQLPLLLLSLPK